MDTTRIMMQLRETVDRMNIPIEQKEITTFDEVSETIVFNCTGLGSKTLNEDDKMIAVRGHLLNLNEAAGIDHMDYMIYTKIKESGRYVYMFPKCLQVTSNNPQGTVVYGTLRGTFIPYTDLLSEEELKELDKTEFKILYDRNLKFFWGTSSTQ